MSETAAGKKHILFLYSDHTEGQTLAWMRLLLTQFPAERYITHLKNLGSSQQSAEFQKTVAPIQAHLHLVFGADCLGFPFTTLAGFPLFNAFWTPCATWLTAHPGQFDRLLRAEWNRNITILCSQKAHMDYIHENYPELADVRCLPHPTSDMAPLLQTLLSLAERYPY